MICSPAVGRLLLVSDPHTKLCAASFDNLRVVPKSHLVERLCTLDTVKVIEASAALRAAIDC